MSTIEVDKESHHGVETSTKEIQVPILHDTPINLEVKEEAPVSIEGKETQTSMSTTTVDTEDHHHGVQDQVATSTKEIQVPTDIEDSGDRTSLDGKDISPTIPEIIKKAQETAQTNAEINTNTQSEISTEVSLQTPNTSQISSEDADMTSIDFMVPIEPNEQENS
jgi:hypothetical protein